MCRHRTVMRGLRPRSGVPRPDHRGRHGHFGGDKPCAAYPRDGARRRRRADTAADQPAVALYLGPRPWSVGDGRGVVAGLTVAFGLGAFLWYRTTVEPSPGFPLQYAP